MSERKMNELDVFRHELLFDGVSGEDFAKSIGMSYASYKNVVRDGSKVVPKWVLAFLFGRGYVYVGGVLVQKKSDAPHKFGSPSYSVKYENCTTNSIINDVVYSEPKNY
tara:strand:- start:906 stop:1232 length:327 start_codon:yes stop_codon:yes gene_type:complete